MRFYFIISRRMAHVSCWAALLGALLPAACRADSPAAEAWNAKFQATYIWQEKLPFSAPYSGANSLGTSRETSYSFTTTAAFGWRPWADGELYFDAEGAQGVPLSGLTGLGGFTNGDMGRTSGPTLTVYRARLLLRQNWDLGGEREAVESAANQLAGSVGKRRLVLTAGNLSVLDVFDGNAYSHDPRTQFLNWSLMTYGAYDYAADARGYSWGAALEWYHDDWVLRAGRFAQPKQPNEQELDPRLFRHYGDQLEVEHAHTIGGQPGRVRLLAFHNRARMARFADALDKGAPPSIDAVRSGDQAKRGLGLSLEQAVSDDVGLFARASWADGQTETYAFTEIDRSVAAGAVVKGTGWGRAQDSAGVAVASNRLSGVHRDYLRAGGLGFFIGDGRLNYRPENVCEAYYNFALTRALWMTLDWQHVRNPAYNADRGPANVASVRLYTEF